MPASKLNDDVVSRLSFALRQGSTYDLAAQYAGICRKTLYSWLCKANDGDDAYLPVLHAVKSAEAFGALDMLQIITESAASGSWQAAAWLLERRHGYRKDTHLSLSTEAADDTELTIVDPDAPDGRALVIEHVAQLPEDLILAALNLKNAGDAK
jgi:hypothetical protein